MALMEGFGDEVILFAIFTMVIGVLIFGWLSTYVRPVWGERASVWVVQMQTWPQRRILQVMQVDDTAEARQQARERVEVSQSSPSADTEPAESPPVEAEDASTPESPPEGPGDTKIRLKFLDETQKLVDTFLTLTVAQFKREHFETEVQEGKVIRLIYQGQLLRDDTRSLASYGLQNNSVVHCHVSSTPYTPPVNGGGPQDQQGQEMGGMQLGRYVYVLLALKFSALWLFYIRYPHYFEFVSLFSLAFCTVIFLAAVYGSMRRNRLARAQNAT